MTIKKSDVSNVLSRADTILDNYSAAKENDEAEVPDPKDARAVIAALRDALKERPHPVVTTAKKDLADGYCIIQCPSYLVMEAGAAAKVFATLCEAIAVDYNWGERTYKRADTDSGDSGRVTMRSFTVAEFAAMELSSD